MSISIPGKLHRQVGGYPGNQHRMPICCDVLRAEMEDEDQVLKSPPKGIRCFSHDPIFPTKKKPLI